MRCSPPGGPRAPRPDGHDDDDPVLTALEAVVRAASPLERALVGAGSVWGAGPDEVADLLGMPVADVRDRAATLRGRLVAAHDAARAAEGLAPADWALDVDLDAVVEHLLAGQGDPPDPAALVEERRRSVRRRSVVAGGAAAVAAGALGWWVVGRRPASASTGARTPSGRCPAAADQSWESVSRWAARGRLATDARVQGLVISRSTGVGRLLFADDVAGQRLVVSATLNPGTEDLIVQAWQGGRGATRGPCRRCPCRARSWRAARAPWPLAVPDLARAPCCSCWPARPSPEAQYSTDVRPHPRRAPSAAAGCR